MSRPEALRLVAGALDSAEVEALAQMLEIEIAAPLGLLRPDDRVADVFTPFTIGNPLTWMFAEAALEDGLGEVQYQLGKRLHARRESPPTIQTVRELFVAWRGKVT